MATNWVRRGIPKSNSEPESLSARPRTPRIVIDDGENAERLSVSQHDQGRLRRDGPPGGDAVYPHNVANRRWDSDTCSYSGSGSDGLEPVWAGAVQPTGDLFYLEPGNNPRASSDNPPTPQPTAQEQTKSSQTSAKKKKKNLATLQKIIRRKKSSDHMNVNNNRADSLRKNIKQTSRSPRRAPSIHRGRSGQTRDVILRVDMKLSDTTSQGDRLASWLGIVHSTSLLEEVTAQNGSTRTGLASPTSGKEPNNKRPTSGSWKEQRVSVRGLIPSGVAIKSGEIELGDTIISINSIPVLADTVDSVLASMASVSLFKVQLQRVGLGSWEKYIVPPQRPLINGSLVKLISGERLQDIGDPLRDVCHIVAYLTLGREDDNEDKDILYEFPTTNASRILIDIRGLFITLGDMLQTITDSSVQSTSLVIDNQLVHISYFKSGREMLVMGIPADRVPTFQLDCIIKDVTRLLCFLYESLDNAFQDSNHPRLNHLFSLLFQRLLLADNLHSQATNTNIFLEGLPGVRWLDLPEDIKINIDCSLTDLEAADFADMSDDHYEDRRPYSLLGACHFYKGYLTASHLARDDLQDISIYCRNYSLMVLSSQQQVGQLVIWKEVYPTRRSKQRTEPVVPGYQEPEGRWFLLIIGQRHSLLCLLMEAGGCSSRCEGNPAPDPFYVDQVRATLLHLESLSVPLACEERLSAPPIPALSCADWFFPTRKSTTESGTPPLPISASPMLSKLHSQSPARGRKLLQADPTSRSRRSSSPNQLTALSPHGPRRSPSSRPDSENESDTASPYESRTNSTQSSPAINRRRLTGERKGSDVSGGSIGSMELYKAARKKRLIPDPYNMGMMQQGLEELQCNDYYTATKLTAGHDNTLFHYVHLDKWSGIIACPTHCDRVMLGGNCHAQLITNFHQCCITIRQVLNRGTRLKPNQPSQVIHSDQSLGYVREYGVMFRCRPCNWQDQKKSPPSINYWTVGRLFEDPYPRESYVCYHESATQNTIELAFKLSFGVGL